MPDGSVIGEPPRTQTLGFRWSAIDNPFVTAGDLGAEEWLALHSRDHDNAEKKQCQFVWTLPARPPVVDLTPLDPDEVQKRTTELKKGVVPSDCIGIAIGVDTGKRVLHWEAKAIRSDGGSAVVEYGDHPVEADRHGVYQGLLLALRQLRDYFERGWTAADGRTWKPSQVWIDSGWHEHKDAVYEFCREANKGLKVGRERYRPAKGYGEGQPRVTRYTAPKQKNAEIVYIGKEYHMSWLPEDGVILVHVNADHWKSEFHQGLAMPPEEPLAITLFEGSSQQEHFEYSQQITAEKQVEKWIEGRGNVTVWVRVHRKNHFLDAGYNALTAANFVLEMHTIAQQRKRAPSSAPSAPVATSTSSSQSYLLSQRED
jgi:phage terminase large subunit GpA-like protein